MALPFAAYFQPQLALMSFRLRSRPKSQPGALLELRGRPSGIIHAVLNLMGLSPITDLKVTNTEVRQHTKNIFGDLSHIIPPRQVESIAFGSSKPVLYLSLAMMCLIFGISLMFSVGAMGLVGGLVGAGLFIVLFIMGQSYVLTFTAGSTMLADRFKSGSGKGRVDWKLLMQSVDVIREMLSDADQPGGSKLYVAGPMALDEEDDEEDEDEDEPPPPRRGRSSRRDDDDDDR